MFNFNFSKKGRQTSEWEGSKHEQKTEHHHLQSGWWTIQGDSEHSEPVWVYPVRAHRRAGKCMPPLQRFRNAKQKPEKPLGRLFRGSRDRAMQKVRWARFGLFERLENPGDKKPGICSKNKHDGIVKIRKSTSFVIPAPHPVRDKLQPESRLFSRLRRNRTLVFTGSTTF